jgi:hypothetical protein
MLTWILIGAFYIIGCVLAYGMSYSMFVYEDQRKRVDRTLSYWEMRQIIAAGKRDGYVFMVIASLSWMVVLAGAFMYWVIKPKYWLKFNSDELEAEFFHNYYKS